MTQNEQNYSGITQILVVVLLAMGAIWVQMPIQADRPASRGEGLIAQGIQDVDARLWQDPFEAVSKGLAKRSAALGCKYSIDAETKIELRFKSGHCESGFHSLEWLREQLKARRDQGQHARGMLVMVPGGNWVGADEARRRTRYAVLAGLNVEGYAPVDPEHIGVVIPGGKGQGEYMPFEWLEKRRKAADTAEALLLVWLDEERMQQDRWREQPGAQAAGKLEYAAPLRELHTTLDSLVEEESGAPGWILLGPSSSTFLLKAAREVDPSHGYQLNGLLARGRLTWYSPFVSMPDEQIDPDANSSLRALLRTMVRISPDDDRLSDVLVAELRQRRFGSGGNVALVGQWDTGYARALRQMLRERLAREPSPVNPDAHIQVIEESFLRGIDGKLSEASEKKADKSEQKDKDRTEIAPPGGDGQVDYLRRLGWKLKLQERIQGRIGAIGVLGNDYYDKLMVLRALRPAFPDTVFFTTDVDAAMLDPKFNPHTRNLVLATDYGLNLKTALQKDIPPFRDNDQTALFIATRLAMGSSDMAKFLAEARGKIRLYEVGRSELVPLACENIQDCGIPDEDNPRKDGWRWILVPTSLVALIGLLSAIIGFSVRKHLCFWFLASLLTAAAAALLFLLSSSFEPMRWLEGVSIWPTEALRMLALLLALALFREGVKHVRRARARIDHEFFPSTVDAPLPAEASLCWSLHFLLLQPHRWRRFWHTLDREGRLTHARLSQCLSPRTEPEAAGVERNAHGIWKIFNGEKACRDSPLPLRLPFWLAAALFVLLYLLLVPTLAAMGWPVPQTPARGEAAFLADRVILMCTVIALLFLLYLALFEAFRAIWLSRKLQGTTIWPKRILHGFWPRGEKTLDKEHEEALKMEQELFDPWLDVRFIGYASEPVQKIIFYPFVILALLIFSRSSLFDRWGIPVVIILIIGISLALLIIASIRMRAEAEKVRRISIRQLKLLRLRYQAEQKEVVVRQIDAMEKDIMESKTGVFAHFGQQPLVKALLALGGSLSGVALLEAINGANL